MREEDLAHTEELKMNHLSVEEVAARRAEVRKMRELTFRAEVKAKRMAKIKSKAFRRLKKKEREAALERKAKEFEIRVGELEKECEALRRENGWLKGLVVGVTGAGAVQQQQQGAASSATKRPRDESEVISTA